VATIVKPQAMSLPSFAFAVGKMLCNIIWPTSRWLGGAGRKWKTVYMMDATRDEREQLVRMVAEGRLSVVVDSIWGFRDVLGGYDVLWSGRAKGKVVVRVDGDEE
jgi:reticulon-4-interacting protein 1, mitochondrial